MHQIGVLHRRKAIEKTTSELTGKFTIKKTGILIESCFFRKNFNFFLFFKYQEISHVSYEGSPIDKT